MDTVNHGSGTQSAQHASRAIAQSQHQLQRIKSCFENFKSKMLAAEPELEPKVDDKQRIQDLEAEVAQLRAALAAKDE